MWNTGNFFINLFPYLATVIVVLCMMPAIKLARVLGVIDEPGGRKQHDRAVPPIGGLVVFPVFMILLVLGGVDIQRYWALFVSLIVLLVTGAFDDRFSLNAWLKFFIQIGVAVFICAQGEARVMYLGDFGFVDQYLWTGWMAWPFTIAAIVLLINAVNLMDGLDGLAGGMAVVMFGWMMIAAGLAGFTDHVFAIAVLVGALSGFLVFNMRNPWRRKASVFMGDAGSMCLGLCIGWFAIHMARWPTMPLAPVSVAWIIALPVFDACAQFYRRVREGRHPFSPDRGHFHHHFIAAGMSVRATTLCIMGIVAIMGAFGYFGVKFGIPQIVMLALWGVALFAHMAMAYKKERYVRLIAKFTGVPVKGDMRVLKSAVEDEHGTHENKNVA